MKYVLSYSDCVEMQECYEYYRDDVVPVKHYHLAEMFGCSTEEVREVIGGFHPALLGVVPVVRPVGRPRKPKPKGVVGRPRKNVV